MRINSFIKGLFGLGIVTELNRDFDACSIFWIDGRSTHGQISYYEDMGHETTDTLDRRLVDLEYFAAPEWILLARSIQENHNKPDPDRTLKTIAPYFEMVWSKQKPFELRKNDRGFQVGDVYFLVEYSDRLDRSLDRWIKVKITCVVETLHLIRGCVALGIEELDRGTKQPVQTWDFIINSVKCHRCNGKGTIDGQPIVGIEGSEDGTFDWHQRGCNKEVVLGYARQKCPDCNGSGYKL